MKNENLNKTTERNLEKFKYKLDQNIKLKNQIINNLNEELSTLKLAIIQQKDKLNNFIIKNQQINDIKKNNLKFIKINKNLEGKKQFNFQKIQIKNDYNLKLNEINLKFEEKLKNIDFLKNNFDFKLLYNTIKNLKNLILIQKKKFEQRKNFNIKIKNDFNEKNLNLNDNIINKLSKELEIKNKIKINLLNEEKKKLNECINKLEEEEKNHLFKMNSFSKKLKKIDLKYENQIQLLEKQFQNEFKYLIKKEKDINKKSKIIIKLINEKELNHKTNLSNLIEENNFLKESINELNNNNSLLNIKIKFNDKDLLKKIKDLEELIFNKDLQLKELRKNNLNLKLNFSRLTHKRPNV